MLSTLCFGLSFIQLVVSADLRDFDDSIQYRLRWPGVLDGESVDPREVSDHLIISTYKKEQYNCSLPVRKKSIENSDEEYTGQNPLELLMPLFQSSSCFTRIESYWSYEICHGKHIKQYHEEKDGKKIKRQEYYLGRWDKLMTKQLHLELEKAKEEGRKPPSKKIEGVSVPYLELNFTDGTVCDLTGEPRQISVHYMCLNNTKNDLLSINELASCIYQMNVFSVALCKHPHYRPEELGNYDIYCYAENDSPKVPSALVQMNAASMKRRHFRPPSDKNENVFAVYTIDKQDGEMKLKLEFVRTGDLEDVEEELRREEEREEASGKIPSLRPTPPAPTELPFAIKEFLSGKQCLRGGSGWWKYKFCYGKTVEQYHVESRADGSVEMTSILLGIFDREAHLDWVRDNPHKRPKPLNVRTSFSQLYTNGEICENTGRPRHTEVRMKCVDQKGTVSLYLLEPQVCQYILGVESPLVCDLLDKVNDDGLIDRAALVKPLLP